MCVRYRCNPSNPTGAVHPRALLEELAAVLRKWPRVVIIADEIYEQITFDETAIAFATIPGACASVSALPALYSQL